MASTYALPVNSSSHTLSHGHSPSQHRRDSSTSSWNNQPNGASPVKGHGHGLSAGAHRHHSYDMGSTLGPGQSPYSNRNTLSHDHVHDRSQSIDSTYTLKAFSNGRPRGRPRGESDLGRPPSRKTATASKFGFSPIHETPIPPPTPSSSFLELPEALTALLIPLPYLLASLAYSNLVGNNGRLPTSLSDAAPAGEAKDSLTPPQVSNSGQFLYACSLSSVTLIVIALSSKIRSSADQPLDRRKSLASSETSRTMFDILADPSSIVRLPYSACSILLPFYATMQLGGAKTALFLLAAVTAGLGGLDHKPGRHSMWDELRRTLRTRKATCGVLLLGLLLDVCYSEGASGILLGYSALLASVIVAPLPLPTTGWSILTGVKGQDSWNAQRPSRASLPKPSSPLVNSPEDAAITLGAGVLLTGITLLLYMFSSSLPSLTNQAILALILSIAAAVTLVYFSLPSALRSQKKVGLALGSILIAAFGVWEHPESWQTWGLFPLTSALVFGAVTFDTNPSAITRAHSHSHSHSGHSHSHSHDLHDHHLHGNHSKISAFLIARATPGSIIHSILIEKDSRRIAYFGVLNLSFMLVQFFYGYVSGSLGLLTDSIHMLFDCAGLAVGLAAAVMSKWPPNVRFPYGYGKVDTLSGFANGVFLLLVSVEIIFDAFERLYEGHELQRLNELLIVSILGFIVNIVGLTAFGHAHHGHGHSHDHDHGDHGHSHGHSHSHSHDNENMQGIFLHILADALGSVAVIISTLLTKYYGWSGWDPIASCIIAILIFVSAIPLVKSSGMRLMLSLSADTEYSIRNTLQELSSLRGVVGYSVPKFWLEDEGAAHAEVHAKDHKGCDHGHTHDHGHEHTHDHEGHDHSHSDSSAHEHSHDHAHSHSHDHHHDHSDHHHDHDHDHSHASGVQRILGVIHIIASQGSDPEDVRERAVQFLKDRNLEVVVHIEKEGEGRCWCGGGNKVN